MKKLIRIVTIGETFDLLKGQLRFLNEYFDVIGVASGKEKMKTVADCEGVKTIAIAMRREISPWQDLKSLLSLIVLFLREHPSIVHASTPKASLLAMIAAWIARVPYRIYTVTGLRFETTSGLFRSFLIFMERLTCFFATKVIPEGDGVRKTLVKERITQKSLEKILNGNINGVDLAYFHRTQELLEQCNIIREKIGAKKKDFVFGFVGRLVSDKGVNELAQAFARLYEQDNRARLLLVGSFERELDPLLPETEALIKNCSGIYTVGYQADVRPYYVAFDALVFPSYREGFPNVVLQAGAMGLPSIVTNISGCNEIIIEGENGTIISPRNADELYKAMKNFLEKRNSLVVQMAKNARKLIEARYEQSAVWEATLGMYNSLAKTK